MFVEYMTSEWEGTDERELWVVGIRVRASFPLLYRWYALRQMVSRCLTAENKSIIEQPDSRIGIDVA